MLVKGTGKGKARFMGCGATSGGEHERGGPGLFGCMPLQPLQSKNMMLAVRGIGCVTCIELKVQEIEQLGLLAQIGNTQPHAPPTCTCRK